MMKSVYEAIHKTISEELKAGGSVTKWGLDIFKVMDSPERKGRNPRSGDALTIPACKKIKFTATESVKKALNEILS